MKKNKKIFWIPLSILLILLICGGGIYMQIENHQREEKMEMIKIAKDHKKEMDEQVRYGDKDHHIKTITYKWDTVEHNPMGGFMMDGYINGDKKIDFQIVFEKNNGKKIECWCSPISAKLGDWKGM